jgi:hypothetical protein
MWPVPTDLHQSLGLASPGADKQMRVGGILTVPGFAEQIHGGMNSAFDRTDWNSKNCADFRIFERLEEG